jgi:TonB-dependent receptor
LFEATDNLILRASYTRTLGRPNFSDLKRGEDFGVPNDEDPNDPRISVSRGNPDLEPIKANNFDASAEYYFDEGGSLVSFAVFYKDIEDLIFSTTQVVPDFEYEGQLYTATVTQPINATNSSIHGVELSIRKDFSNTLPSPFDGLVFNGNITSIGSEFTYLNSAGEERSPGGWINQPELLLNAELSYERSLFGAKIAYRWVDEYFSNILNEDGDIHDTYAQARGIWDLQARFQVTDSLTFLGEVRNLTEEGLEFNRRFPSGDLLGGSSESGRIVWLGVNATF